MQRWAGLDDVPDDAGPCVVTIGVFDGVHRGHAALITRAVESARARGLACVVLTFDPHPLRVVAPEHAPALLATLAHRLDVVAGLGVAATLVLPFDSGLAALEPARFVEDVLVGRLHAQLVVVGANFTFGHGGSGTVADLAELGAPHGMDVLALDLLPAEPGGVGAISASRIRTALAAGEVERVAQMLGRPFRADGTVVRGEQRGRALGYPTANIDMADTAAVPADGVYAGRVWRLGRAGRASAEPVLLGTGAISVGTNPTFDGKSRTVEAFILDFDADLYGDVLGVEFTHRLRGMVKFDSIDALIAQMDADVAEARKLVA